MMIGTEAENVTQALRPIVWSHKRLDMGPLRILAGRSF
jgi:hypothetical protein